MNKPQKYLTIALWITAVLGMVGILVMKMTMNGRDSANANVDGLPNINTPEPFAKSADQLAKLYTAPAFSLTDQNERKFASSDLAGRVWICDFIFTTCPNVCPVMSSDMHDLQRQLPDSIKLVSFSVDPAHDTPAALAAYASRMHADSNRWEFLTGDLPTIKGIVTNMKLVFEPAAGADPILHDPHFVLVDGEGMVRGAYDSNRPTELRRLVNDAKLLEAATPATQPAGK